MGPKEEIYETCAICKDVTEVDKSTPIESREYYVEGSGQLCRSCWAEIYGTSTDELILSW